MKQEIKKIGKAVAGSALLVGATLTGAAGFAAAQDSGSNGMDLGDYPQPFVSEDGQVQSTIVVGNNAKTSDVVSAINIAGSLSQAAMTEEQVSVSTGSGGSWSATNGVTLDTTNDDIYFGENVNEVRDTLTDSDLEHLADVEFRDDGSETYDITHNLNVGTLPVKFDNSGDELDNEDPEVYVEVPSEGDVAPGSYLYSLQATIDTVDVTTADVAGEDIELFGREYTIANDHEGTLGEGYLKLYGSSNTVDVATGESTTITVDGEEHTLEVVSVDGQVNEASIRVDGEISSEAEDDEFDVDGQSVRVDDVINTGANDDGNGIVQFAIGSEELHIMPDGQVEDGDDDDIDGLYSQINGGSWTEGNGVSSIQLFVGAENDNEDALTAGETFTHDTLDQFEFHFGGLNPDAAAEGSGSEVDFSASGDDALEIGFSTDDEESTSVTYGYTDDTAVSGSGPSDAVNLADSDDDAIHTKEGVTLQEDEYFLADPGDFAHMWEVTAIDRDTVGAASSVDAEDEAEIDLTDAVTGNTVTVDLRDADSESSEVYEGTEIIDGQSYHFELDSDDSTPSLAVTWGENSGFDGGNSGISNMDVGDETSVSAALDTESGASVAVFNEVDVSDGALGDSVSTSEIGGTLSFEDQVVYKESATEATDSSDTVITLSNGGNVNEISVQGTESDGDSFDLSIGGTSSSNDGDVSVAANGGNPTITIADDSEAEIDSIAVTDSSQTATVNPSATNTNADTNNLETFNINPATRTVELPSTESTDAKTAEIQYSSTGTLAGQEFTVAGVTYEVDADGDGELQVQGVENSNYNTNAVASAVITPEDDDDNEHAYVFANGYDTNDEELNSQTLAQNPTSVQQTELESDDDISAGYDVYGNYHQVDSDEQGSISVHVPAGQSTVGAAVTAQDGELSAEGGSGSATTMQPAGWPDAAALDSEMGEAARQSQNLILAGGPAVNTLVSDLADENKTMSTSEYTQGQGMIQLIEGAFAEDQDALVVAGQAAADTNAAADYLANYMDNQEEMSGTDQVTISTETGSVVQ